MVIKAKVILVGSELKGTGCHEAICPQDGARAMFTSAWRPSWVITAARRRSNYKMPAWLQHQEKWDLRLSYSHCGRQPPDTKISLIFTINKTNDEFPTTTHTNSQGSVQTCPHYYNMSKYFVVVVDVVVVVLMLILTFKPKEIKNHCQMLLLKQSDTFSAWTHWALWKYRFRSNKVPQETLDFTQLRQQFR